MTIKEIIKEKFEEETGYKMSDYVQKYVSINLKKYGNKITIRALAVTTEVFKSGAFSNPYDFVKYFNATARNMKYQEEQEEWEEI